MHILVQLLLVPNLYTVLHKLRQHMLRCHLLILHFFFGFFIYLNCPASFLAFALNFVLPNAVFDNLLALVRLVRHSKFVARVIDIHALAQQGRPQQAVIQRGVEAGIHFVRDALVVLRF